MTQHVMLNPDQMEAIVAAILAISVAGSAGTTPAGAVKNFQLLTAEIAKLPSFQRAK